MADLSALVGSHRLVTITGVGGVGKTRLALAAAPSAQICLLARCSAPAEVPGALAAALGYPSFHAALLGLVDRGAFLVLDNCEHVLDAVADAVEGLLLATSDVSVLCTSREPLAVPAEHVLRLAPLALAMGSEPPEVAASPAVQLFLTRAAAAGSPIDLDPGTAPTVAEVCRRLDGLPLAIELAAARTPTLTPMEILGHLDHRLALLVGHRRAPPRHRSLQAMIDWSYERLDPDTRWFFDRLGVAEALFTADAAHAVAGLPGEDLLAVVDRLDHLVAQSLVQVHRLGNQTWYGLLETLRAYARARLAERGELDAIADRCINWTVARCVEVRNGSLRAWPAELAVTADALRHDVHDALVHTLDRDDRPDRAFPLFRLLWDADLLHGRARLVADRGAQLLARWPDAAHPGWAETAAVAATAHIVLDEHAQGRALGRRALEVGESPLASVIARRAIGLADVVDAAFTTALSEFEAGIDVARRHELTPWYLELETFRAIALAGLGRHSDAVATAQAAHRTAAASVGPELTAWCSLVHAQLRADEEPDVARAVVEQVVTGAGASRLERGLGYRIIALIALATGGYRDAALSLRAALDSVVGAGDVHVRTTVRSVAALARVTGREEAASALAATAGARSAVDPLDLLVRPQLDRHLAGLVMPPVTAPLRDAVVRARVELDLLASDTCAASAAAPDGVFRREGGVWTLTFESTTVRLPHAKGLQDLATLLASPGREMHCTELIGAAVESPDTGPLLDLTARRDYERRILELQGDLVEAEDAHDQGTADKARLEMDLLVEHLAAVTGLGGRSRRAGAVAERARAAVGWRIRAAITRIEGTHPPLGRHLRSSVRAGAWCTYLPEGTVHWLL